MADGDIRILESFDRYAETGDIGRMNAIWTNNHALVPGRYFGGKACNFQGSGTRGVQSYAYIDERIHRWTIGCAILPTERSHNTLLAATGPSGALVLGYKTNGRLEVHRDAWGSNEDGYSLTKVIADGNKVDAIIEDIWQYVEWQITQVGNTGNIKAWVNGELCMDVVDAVINRPNGFDGFGLSRSGGTGTHSFDDFYMREGPDRLGEIKIESIIPDGTVSNTMSLLVGADTAHQAVNENPVDGDASYIASLNAGDGARFSVGNLTAAPDFIRAVQVRSFGRKDETAYRSVKNSVSVAGSELKGKEHVLGVGYKFFRDIFPMNPNTGTPWTQAAIDSMNIGVDIHA